MNEKPTLKFTLLAGAQYQDGFKLDFKASGKEEIEIARDLTDKLIAKIDKITVNIGGDFEG